MVLPVGPGLLGPFAVWVFMGQPGAGQVHVQHSNVLGVSALIDKQQGQYANWVQHTCRHHKLDELTRAQQGYQGASKAIKGPARLSRGHHRVSNWVPHQIRERVT